MRRLSWLIVLAAGTLGALFLVSGPIPQPQAYHHFADQRRLIAAVPNTLNVMSNAAFVIAGIAGLMVMRSRRAFANGLERADAIAFFLGTLLTAAGSTIYHLNPNDATLVWDRGGMIVAFMAFLAMIVHERYDGAPWLLPALILLGAGSVVWWRAFDDLRPYGWVQFFPIVAVIYLVVVEKPRHSGEAAALAWVLLAYVLAKLFELYDRAVYEALRETVSGHTLKHVAAAGAAGVVAAWIARRDPVVIP